MSVNFNPAKIFNDYVQGNRSVESDAKLAVQICEEVARGEIPTDKIADLLEDKVSDRTRNIILGTGSFLTTFLLLSKGVAPKLIKKIAPEKLANATFSDLAKYLNGAKVKFNEQFGDKEIVNKVMDSKVVSNVKNATDKFKQTNIGDKISKISADDFGNNKVFKFLGVDNKPLNLAVSLGLAAPAAVAAKNTINNVADGIDADMDDKRRALNYEA